jgi:hypothetical protein
MTRGTLLRHPLVQETQDAVGDHPIARDAERADLRAAARRLSSGTVPYDHERHPDAA